MSGDALNGLDARKALQAVKSLGGEWAQKPATGEIEVWHPDHPELGRILIQHYTRRKDASRGLSHFVRKLKRLKNTESSEGLVDDVEEEEERPGCLARLKPEVVRRVVMEEVTRTVEIDKGMLCAAILEDPRPAVVEAEIEAHDDPINLRLVIYEPTLRKVLQKAGLNLDPKCQFEVTGQGTLRVRWTETTEREEEA